MTKEMLQKLFIEEHYHYTRVNSIIAENVPSTKILELMLQLEKSFISGFEKMYNCKVDIETATVIPNKEMKEGENYETNKV